MKQVVRVSSSAAACDRVAGGEAPAPHGRAAAGSGEQGMGSGKQAAGSVPLPKLATAWHCLLSSSTTAIVHLGQGFNGRDG